MADRKTTAIELSENDIWITSMFCWKIEFASWYEKVLHRCFNIRIWIMGQWEYVSRMIIDISPYAIKQNTLKWNWKLIWKNFHRFFKVTNLTFYRGHNFNDMTRTCRDVLKGIFFCAWFLLLLFFKISRLIYHFYHLNFSLIGKYSNQIPFQEF